jgi:hypothetical protein
MRRMRRMSRTSADVVRERDIRRRMSRMSADAADIRRHQPASQPARNLHFTNLEELLLHAGKVL